MCFNSLLSRSEGSPVISFQQLHAHAKKCDVHRNKSAHDARVCCIKYVCWVHVRSCVVSLLHSLRQGQWVPATLRSRANGISGLSFEHLPCCNLLQLCIRRCTQHCTSALHLAVGSALFSALGPHLGCVIAHSVCLAHLFFFPFVFANFLHGPAGDYGSDYGDDGYGGAPPSAIMESIREEDSPANSARSIRQQRSGKFDSKALDPIQDSGSPTPQDYGRQASDKRISDTWAAPAQPQPQAQAGPPGKASKYDVDGFLMDSDDEQGDKVQPLRPTPAAPPSEYEEVYDSSPAPSVTSSPRVADLPSQAATTFAGGAHSRHPPPSAAAPEPRNLAKQISQLAEEESDEDDFLAAAVAAVEAQDRGQPLPAKRAQQQPTAPLPAAPAPTPFSKGPQAQPQGPSRDAHLPPDDESRSGTPQQGQPQQNRQQTVPSPVPKVWERPSAVVDTEDAPQRSDQSLRARYGGNRQPAATTASNNDASSAAAAFFAARTGSGGVPAANRPETVTMQSMSSRPLLGGDVPSQKPAGPVPIARPPTSAYGGAAAAAPPRPTSQWFRSKPAVPPPAPTPAQGQAPSEQGYVNPFDAPKPAQQRPQQEAGMFMDESDEEDAYSQGSRGRAAGQQPQQQAGIKGAITAGAAGTALHHHCNTQAAQQYIME